MLSVARRPEGTPLAAHNPDAPKPGVASGIVLGAIILGALLGTAAPASIVDAAGSLIDPAVLLFVTLLLIETPLAPRPEGHVRPKTMFIALAMNFLLVPLLALGLAHLVIPDHALLRLGVIIYCLFPCTDWFLGFTKLAGGDRVTAAALLPVNLALQLMLYPLWVGLLTGSDAGAGWSILWTTLLTWCCGPVLVALTVRGILWGLRRGGHPHLASRLHSIIGGATMPVLGIMVALLFASKSGVIFEHPATFARILLVVFLFFVAMALAGKFVANMLRLDHETHALVSITTAARNAPLMLVLTTIVLPNAPLVHAAIVLGMLIEFPHLATLTHILARRRFTRTQETDARHTALRRRPRSRGGGNSHHARSRRVTRASTHEDAQAPAAPASSGAQRHDHE